ncbi:MAG: protein-disulfide reductase DsbD domain-containing protein [Saprospiraceae bacterium]
MKLTYFLLFFSFLFSTNINAQNPVKWDFAAKKIQDTEYEITFTATVASGWSIYSQHTDPSGPVPTVFGFDENANLEFIGKPVETGKKKEAFDELFGVKVIKFSGAVNFTQKVKVKSGAKAVTGYLEFMACDDEKCLPPKEVDFNILLE